MKEAQRRMLYRALLLAAAGCFVLALFLVDPRWNTIVWSFLVGGFVIAAAGLYIRAGGKKDDKG